MPSTARQFYEEILLGGVPFIEDLVVKRQHETEWLDFKTGAYPRDPKEAWSEAVCGFGNNQGGVFIWGVVARKDTENVDAASDLVPVENPAALRSRLVELLRTAVEPPLPGVEVTEFYKAGSFGPGYVVCFVPESPTKPHRAELVLNKPYMLRIADSFINPSPSILRNLFFPRSAPQLSIVVQPDWDIGEANVGDNEIEVRYQIGIQNVGFATARDISILIKTKPDLEVEPTFRVEELNTADGVTGYKLKNPIHPSSFDIVGTVRHPGPGTISRQGDKRILVPRYSRMELNVDIFAADMLPARLQVIYEGDEIRFKRRSAGTYRPD